MATPIHTASGPVPVSTQEKSYGSALAAITSLFFIFGFITCLNDILIPHLKGIFELNYAQAALIQFCFFAAYFIVSLPAGKLLAKIGYKNGLIGGLIIAAVGCTLFYPAAAFRSYGFFLLGLFVLASGITTIQVAANPYVAVLGKPETSSARLNLVQAFNSLGTTIAPLLGSALILSATVLSPDQLKAMNADQLAAYHVTQAQAVQMPYLGLALSLVVLALLIKAFRLPMISPTADSEGNPAALAVIHKKSAWEFSHLSLGAIGIFVYVGAEVSIGSFLVNYLSQPEIAGLREADAGQYVSLYWGGAMIGRFVGSAILQRLDAGKVLATHALIAAMLVVLTMLTTGKLAMGSVLAVGLFNSIMFPTIFTLAIRHLGKFTAQGSGILCMAIVGGALLPVFQGFLADRIGIHHSFLMPVLCYLYIAFYGLKGSRLDA